MNKIFSTLTIAAFAGLLLTGCAGGESNSDPNASPNPAVLITGSAVPIQPADGEQRDKLIDELKKINPALGEQRHVARANQICQMTLGGASEEAKIARAMNILEDAEGAPVSDQDQEANAKKIIEIINTNGFCKAEG